MHGTGGICVMGGICSTGVMGWKCGTAGMVGMDWAGETSGTGNLHALFHFFIIVLHYVTSRVNT